VWIKVCQLKFYVGSAGLKRKAASEKEAASHFETLLTQTIS